MDSLLCIQHDITVLLLYLCTLMPEAFINRPVIKKRKLIKWKE